MTTFRLSRPGPPASGPLRWLLGVGAFVALLGVASPVSGATFEPKPLFVTKSASSPPELVFEPEAVVARGLSPGAEVIFHGVTREHGGFFWRVVQTREVVLTDALGEARLELPAGEVGPLSVWTVVDPATGDFSLGTPAGSTAREVPFPADGLARTEAGLWWALRTRYERLEVLYVRPGEGAWWLTAIDGGSGDDDRREDSSLRASLEEARPLWGAEAPSPGFRPGDVVVAVSLDSLTYFAARLVDPADGP